MTPSDSFLLRPASIHFHQTVRCMLQLESLCFRTAQSKGGRVARCSDGGGLLALSFYYLVLCSRICKIGMLFLVFDGTSILDTHFYTHEVSNKDNEN